jgi:hypothetical protein
MPLKVATPVGEVRRQTGTSLAASGKLYGDLGYALFPTQDGNDCIQAENSCAVVEEDDIVKAMIFAGCGGHSACGHNGVYVFSFVDWTWGAWSFTAWTWECVLVSSNNYGNPIPVATVVQHVNSTTGLIDVMGVNGFVPPEPITRSGPNERIGPVGTDPDDATNVFQQITQRYPNTSDSTFIVPASRHTYGGVVWHPTHRRVYLYCGSSWSGGGGRLEQFWELSAPDATRTNGRAWAKRADPWLSSGGPVLDMDGRWTHTTGVSVAGSEIWNDKILVKTIARLQEVTVPATGTVHFHSRSGAGIEVGHSEGADTALIEREKGWFCVMGVTGRQSATVTASPGMSYYNLATDPTSRIAITTNKSNDNYRIFETRANWGEALFAGHHGPGPTWASSARKKIVMWGNRRPAGSSYNSLYTLHLTGTGTAVSVSVERHDLRGDVVPVPDFTGTYRKFVYLPQEDAFVAYAGFTQGFFAFRLQPAGATKQIALPSSLAVTVGTPA